MAQLKGRPRTYDLKTGKGTKPAPDKPIVYMFEDKKTKKKPYIGITGRGIKRAHEHKNSGKMK